MEEVRIVKWSRSHCTGDRRTAWSVWYDTAWSVRYAHGVEVHAATLGAGQVSGHHLCPQCLREDGEPTASPGLVLIRQSRKTGDVCWTCQQTGELCAPIILSISAVTAAVDRKLIAFRGCAFSFAGSPTGEEGFPFPAQSIKVD